MSEETLITEGQNTQQTDGQQTAGHDSQQQQQGDAKAAPEGKTEDTAKSDAKPQGAPEKYEFTPPEGREFDASVLDKYSEVARELNLSQADAQKMIDTLAPALAEKQTRIIEEARKTWETDSRNDAEFGGDKLNASMADAKRALDAFGSPKLTQLLNETGLGNHPEIIRLFVKAGKAISEDSFVPSGKPMQNGAKPDYGKVLYPNSNMN